MTDDDPRPDPAPVVRAPWPQRIRAAVRRRAVTYRDRSLAWRLLTPAVFALAGTLLVTSGINARGTDLRAEHSQDLPSLVQQQRERTDRLLARVAALTAEVDELSEQVRDTGQSEAQQQVDALEGPAGLLPVTGPGVTVTLEDAPAEVIDASDVDPNQLIVHQQDIQAVANAMWAGGAEAMTIQGQRVVSTTGIKCVGNTVILHGVPYSPPYVVSAVGDPQRMLASIEGSPYIQLYRQVADEYGLGWDLEVEGSLELPGFDRSPDLRYARTPAGSGA